MTSARLHWMLQGLMSRGGITAVHWATDTRHPGREKFVSMGGDYVRTFLVLSGQRHVRVMQEGILTPLVIKAGECLVLGPHSKLVLEYPESYFSIGLALQAKDPRMVVSRYLYPQLVPLSEPPTKLYPLPGFCDDFVMSLASALLTLEGCYSQELYPRRLMETMWLRVGHHQRQARNAGRSKAQLTFGAAEHFIREHFAKPLTRKDLAEHLRIHPSHVTRLFLRFAGESFGGFLLRVRLEAARGLLRDARHTVSEIAYLTGFTSVNYFVRAYRRYYRVTPGRDRSNASPVAS